MDWTPAREDARTVTVNASNGGALYAQRALADALSIPVMMSDADGTVIFFNRAWFEYTGQAPFEKDDLQNWRSYMHPDDEAGVAAAWAQAVARASDIVDMEYRLREAKTGRYRWFKARATALRGTDGAITHWVGTAMDVDEHRRAAATSEEIAAAYQGASLPAVPPVINGMGFCTVYRASARHLTACGDWYDAFALADGSVAVCIGDVMGHGLDAAIVMSKFRQSVRAVALQASRFGSDNPASVLTSVEEAMVHEQGGVAATMFFGFIDAQRETLRWSGAGHVPPLLLRDDGSSAWLQGADAPLGWRFNTKRTSVTTPLRGVRAIVLYTDGLVESTRNIIDGMDCLRAHLEKTPADQADLATGVLESCHEPTGQDDVAILAITF